MAENSVRVLAGAPIGTREDKGVFFFLFAQFSEQGFLTACNRIEGAAQFCLLNIVKFSHLHDQSRLPKQQFRLLLLLDVTVVQQVG